MNTEANFCLKEVSELEEKTGEEDLGLEVIVAVWMGRGDSKPCGLYKDSPTKIQGSGYGACGSHVE